MKRRRCCGFMDADDSKVIPHAERHPVSTLLLLLFLLLLSSLLWIQEGLRCVWQGSRYSALTEVTSAPCERGEGRVECLVGGLRSVAKETGVHPLTLSLTATRSQ